MKSVASTANSIQLSVNIAQKNPVTAASRTRPESLNRSKNSMKNGIGHIPTMFQCPPRRIIMNGESAKIKPDSSPAK